MDTANISAIISATAGICGVLLGNSYVAIKEYLVNRRKRKKDTVYLGIIITSHLDRFADCCLQVANDDGTDRGQPAGSDGQYITTKTPPTFLPLEIDVDWSLLPKELLYPILRLPDQREQLQNWLSGISEHDDDYPDHTEFFWVRRRGYADLGIQALNLARRLREHSGLPPTAPYPSEWNRDQGLRDVVRFIDEKREAYNRRIAENPLVL